MQVDPVGLDPVELDPAALDRVELDRVELDPVGRGLVVPAYQHLAQHLPVPG